MESYAAKHAALETVYKLSVALDDLSYPELAQLFYPDKKFNFDIFAILKSPAKDVTLPEYFNMATGGLGGFDATQHILTNPIVSTNDNGTMNVQVMVTAFHGLMVNGNVEGATLRVRWKIDLEKHNEQWYIIKWAVIPRVPADRPDLFEKGHKQAHSEKLRASIVGP